MGSVFVARKEGDPRWLALKILDPLGESTDELVVRFRREAQFLLSLDHPNIVRAFDVGAAEGRHYISMEYVQGETLESIVKRDGFVEPVRALGIMQQTAQALEYARKLNVVHRDIKPANVLIRQDGVVKLADLGLAILANREDLRLTAPGSLVGTPKFMSPEAVDALRNIDIRSDIYSLGCTFYYAICGEAPFGGQIVDICLQQKHTPPRPPSSLRPGLHSCIERLILFCMEKDRNARYQTPAELISVIGVVQDIFAGKRHESEMPLPVGGASTADDFFGFSGQLNSN
jgi:serine/threonine-protein kinase